MLGKLQKYDDRRRDLINELYEQIIKLTRKHKINFSIKDSFDQESGNDFLAVHFKHSQDDIDAAEGALWKDKM